VTVDGLAALVPEGSLLPINYKTLTGKEYTLIVDRSDKQRYEAVSGVPGDLPLRSKERLVRTGGRSTCVGDAGAVIVDARPADIVSRPPIVMAPPRRCGAGVTPCGAPARLYPCGWRCDEHSPGAHRKRQGAT
jgi:hypothetical protein